MKKYFVLFIVFIQSGMLFNKGLLVLHFFLHREEIAAHACRHTTREAEENCKGICYLKVELSKEDTSPIKGFPIDSLVQKEVAYVEIPPFFPLKISNFKTVIHQTFIVKTPVLYETYLSIWRPPTAVSFLSALFPI